METLLRGYVMEHVSHSIQPPAHPEDLERMLDEIVESLPAGIQVLSDEAFSRETLTGAKTPGKWITSLIPTSCCARSTEGFRSIRMMKKSMGRVILRSPWACGPPKVMKNTVLSISLILIGLDRAFRESEAKNPCILESVEYRDPSSPTAPLQ